MALIQTPVHIIGAFSTGNSFRFETARRGAILSRIGVWAGGSQLRGIRVWFTNSGTPQTFGTPNVGSYREFTFQAGERMTRLSLWGNGAGTRSGGIRFFTTTGREFFHHMTSWGLRQEFAINIASGICVGIRGRHGEDIDALGLEFLLPIAQARMTNVRYPTLDFETGGIQPVTIRSFHDENHSNDLTKNWSNSGSTTTTNASSWSLTTGLEYHATVSVSAGIPMVAQVSTQVGWSISVSGTYTTNFEESETTEWSRSGVLGPRQWLSFTVTTRRGTITLPYEASMEITLSTGTRFSYALNGLYSGINFSRIEINTVVGSLDSTTAVSDAHALEDRTSTTTNIIRPMETFDGPSHAKKITSSLEASDQKHENADEKSNDNVNELHLEYN